MGRPQEAQFQVRNGAPIGRAGIATLFLACRAHLLATDSSFASTARPMPALSPLHHPLRPSRLSVYCPSISNAVLIFSREPLEVAHPSPCVARPLPFPRPSPFIHRRKGLPPVSSNSADHHISRFYPGDDCIVSTPRTNLASCVHRVGQPNSAPLTTTNAKFATLHTTRASVPFLRLLVHPNFPLYRILANACAGHTRCGLAWLTSGPISLGSWTTAVKFAQS